MKRITPFLLLILSLIGCSGSSIEDDSRVTMYCGLGNVSKDYVTRIHDGILNSTGIDVKLIFHNTLDTTTAVANRIKNYDLPADIVATAQKVPESSQLNSFLDLAKYTDILNEFNTVTVNECSIDGGVYQLPFTTRLIGIEYNKTLLNENRWILPSTFDEFVNLKNEVESKGYKFAVSGGIATGHGFNYLFDLMGAEYLNTPDGNEWLKDFRSGDVKIDNFSSKSSYFEEFVEAGLFGELHDSSWNAYKVFQRERALFYFNITNDCYSYKGFRYTSDGKIYGANYAGEEIQKTEDPSGNAVFYNNEYVLYDENNANHKDLTRYTIPGAVVLNDEYGAMPWISKKGTSNCFVNYHNHYLAVDKKYADKSYKTKLQKIEKVLQYMTSEEASNIFTSMYKDGFVHTKSFKIDASRIYYDYASHIKNGYTMPWYYNDFDTNTIVGVGALCNSFIKEKGSGETSLSDIMNCLNKCNNEYVNSDAEVLSIVPESLSIKDTAKLEAIASGMIVDSNLKEGSAEVAIMNYVDDISTLPYLLTMPVSQERLQYGNVYEVEIRSIIANSCSSPIAVKLTGKEINDLLSNGYNVNEDYGYDITFPYLAVTKNNIAIENDKEYLVAIDTRILPKKYLADLKTNDKIYSDFNETPSTEKGLYMYFTKNKTITKDNLLWK